jgi:rubrerythrin
VSRIPRVLEHLKIGFTSEAQSAAKFRAYAHRAEADGHPRLAEKWRELAAGKDELARLQLEAAGKIRGGGTDVMAEIAEERYENDVLYPKMIQGAGADEEAVGLFQRVIEAQKDHLRRLGALRDALNASTGDVQMPEEVVHGNEKVTAG